MAVVPHAFGRLVQEDAARLEDAIARNDLGAMHRLGQQIAERLAFRLAGIAFSEWWANGAEGADEWPVVTFDGRYSMGHACKALQFCSRKTALVPAQKLALPAVGRLSNAREAIAAAVKGVAPDRVRSGRFDLAGAVSSASVKLRSRDLHGGFDAVLQLRNKESHIEGRRDTWPDEHPDYLALMAPLVAAAAEELLGHPEVTAPLAGLMVARLEKVARTPDRARIPMLRFVPDARGLQAAFFSHPRGLTGVAGEPHMAAIAALPDAELAKMRPEFLVTFGRDIARVMPRMLFRDLSRGVPHDPLTGAPLPLGGSQPSASA